MAENFKFKTETKRLLDMMINSIYTHKEIFLRELISNASDAIDKRHFISLTNQNVKPHDYEILVEASKKDRTITITDNGIGMTEEEIQNNLGTIAKSGSKEFLEKIENEKNKDDVDIIGQFGVGFYSAFMVADNVEVYTKSALSEQGYLFKSEGLESYSIEKSDYNVDGSKIVLHLRENTEEENYDEYLDEYRIKDLIKKYSDYVRYPIKTWVTKFTPTGEKDENGNEKENEEQVLETVNSMVPIWKKNKKDVTDEELNSFYKQKFMDWQDPLFTIFTNVEGNVTYNALVFIPKKAPFDLYNEKYEKGLQLYTKGVFILDKCKELVPDYLRFIKGLVDSSDLSLNISREMLQDDRTIQKIASSLEKKILSELTNALKNDREKYEEFFKNYGINLKYGIYENYGQKKDKLEDLILFTTINKDKSSTLAEYVEAMPEGQKDIYFASAKDKDAVLKLPQIEILKKKGYDVLVLTDHVDEFMLQVMNSYKEHNFKSISQGDLDLVDEKEAKALDKVKDDNKELFDAIKAALPEVKDVIVSKRLTDSPVCLRAGDSLSFEMEKVLNAQQDSNGSIKADRILEINPNHAVFKAVCDAYAKDKNSVAKYAKVLYGEALLMEGMPLDNPTEFTSLVTELLMK